MIKRSLILVLTLWASACASTNIQRVMVEIPRPSSIRLESYKELRIADFFVKDSLAGLEINREITSFFKAAWEKKIHAVILLTGAAPVKAEDFKDAAAWKQAVGDIENAVVMAGQASFIRDSRTSLQEEKAGWNNGYFAARNKLAKRLTFTLDLNVVFVRGGTGEILFQKDFKESRTYSDVKQANDFAFYDLLQSAKQKLFRAILGEERLQERYLISR